MKKDIDSLKPLSRAELLDLPAGIISDYNLLLLCQYFDEEQQDRDRETAALELALRSPFIDEMVDYTYFYSNVKDYYQAKGDNEAAIRWALAFLAFTAQHDPANLQPNWLELASTYIEVGQMDTGLALFTRLLERLPGNIWVYNMLAMSLLHTHLNQLAVEVAERGLALLAKNDPEKLQSQFKDFLHKAQKGLANGVDEGEKISPAILQALQAALALPLSVETPEDEDVLDDAHPPVDRLLGLGETEDETVYQEILSNGKTLIPDLIYLGLSRDPMAETNAPLHAARLLNQLRASLAPELDALASWLDHLPAPGERLWLGTNLGKIGGYSYSELEAIALNPDLPVQMRDRAVRELIEQANADESLRSGVIMLMRDLLNREGADQAEEEEFTGFLIGNILDFKARELIPEIERAYAEDRVDTHIVGLDSVYHEFGLPMPPVPPHRSDGFYLRLKCQACDRSREFFTKYVIWDIPEEGETSKQYTQYIMDRDYVCPKCGAVNRYHLAGAEMFKLLDLGLKDIEGILKKEARKAPPKYKPNVYILNGTAMGKRMHTLDAIEEYRRQIAIQPDNPELYMRTGNIFRFIGRYDQALKYYRKALELDGSDPEILIPVATGEHDFGDPQTAKSLYERIVNTGGIHSQFGSLNENVVTAMQGLKALQQGKRSPWEYQLKNPQGEALLPPLRSDMVRAEKKDNRSKRHGKRH